MMEFYQDNHGALYCMDFRKNDLPDESVQMACTSPPYWGLRKYSGEQDLIWGGDENCEHEWGDYIINPLNQKNPNRGPNTIVGKPTREANETIRKDKPGGNFCSLCGAWKGAYGLEPTPEMYVQHTVEILREIRRVLRKDGVVFWNIGDSYNGSGGDHKPGGKNDAGFQGETFRGVQPKCVKTLKPKDLCLIPFRVAIAAQEDGWWVRSIIIWSKPNPMPESVTDRPTESHEYILMLTKSARYYFDQDAVREAPKPKYAGHSVSVAPEREGSLRHDGGRSFKLDGLVGRNIRTVWEFPTQPYPEAHFAVFPEKLPETCIKAASKENDLVLDPFAGSGTVLWVAKKLGRRAVGYELSEEYCALAVERNRQQVLL